jgi:hypothetical protein
MKKCERELNRVFSKKEVQMAKKYMKKMLNILGHKGNVNQNHFKIPPHSCQNGYNQEHKQQMLAKMWNKRTLQTLLVGL